jgi:hypothetical protein
MLMRHIKPAIKEIASFATQGHQPQKHDALGQE